MFWWVANWRHVVTRGHFPEWQLWDNRVWFCMKCVRRRDARRVWTTAWAPLERYAL